MADISIGSLIAPAFHELYKQIDQNDNVHFWIRGGRGSTKSSFISLKIILSLLKNPLSNAIVFRKYATTLETSVYNQFLWALEKLELLDYFKITKSPFRLEYIVTGQQILFFGLDDYQKIKSIKPKRGYFKFVWFEELSEFDGTAEIRSVLQSVMRGGDSYKIFYSYNPPPEPANWVNKEARVNAPNKVIHSSTYLDVPREWLGEQFFIEAEILKQNNEMAYRHEYLGEETGTGLTVFTNVELRKISDEEIKRFDRIREGIDWGYAVDPFVFLKLHYDRKYRRVYIFEEIYKVKLSNEDAIKEVTAKHNKGTLIIADSEEPKSVDDFSNAGIPIRGAKKGPGSVNFGIKRLQGLTKIIIDPERCPNSAREFIEYSLEKNKDETVKSKFPDKDNHTIDAVRYALEDEFSY